MLKYQKTNMFILPIKDMAIKFDGGIIMKYILSRCYWIFVVIAIVLPMICKPCFAETNSKKIVKPKIIIEKDKGNNKILKVKFTDKNNKVIKEADLTYKKQKLTSKEAGFPKYTNNISKHVSKNAWPSKNGNYVIISTEVNYTFIPKDEKEKKEYEGTDATFIESRGMLQLFDSSGAMLWEKHLPRNRVDSEVHVSDNAETIACIIACGEECSFGEEGDELGTGVYVVYVLGRKGDILLKYPDKQTNYGITPGLSLSPNGRYLAFSIRDMNKRGQKYEDQHSTLFFDLKNNRSWNANKWYNTHISNEGIASLKDVGTLKLHNSVNLKQYLGE